MRLQLRRHSGAFMSFIPRETLARATVPGPLNPARTRMVQELRQGSPLLGCRFDPSGRFVFAGTQANTVERWELETGQRVTLTGHLSWVRALAFEGGRLF